MSRFETFTSDAGLPVDVDAIRDQMRSLWERAAAESGDSPVTRACLLNLVVWSTTPPERQRISGTIQRVVEELPARVLFMEVDPDDAGDRLEAWISAHCRVPTAGAKQVCSEQVTLRASASSAIHLPGLLAGLTSSDLPVCLFPAQRPELSDPAFQRLIESADRLIVDSALMDPSDLEFLTTLPTRPSPTAPGDLNWLRLRPYQEMIAGFFDPPFFRPRIPALSHVETMGGPGSETTARLLSGWIRAAVRDPSLRLRHREDPALAAGSLGGIHLRSEGSGKPVTFIVERDQGRGCLVGRVELEGTCPVPRRARSTDLPEWELLAGLLERAGRDSLYEAALSLAIRES